MVLRFRLLAMLIALLACRGVAQTDSQTPTSETDSRVISNLEVLSDTHGVDFGPICHEWCKLSARTGTASFPTKHARLI